MSATIATVTLDANSELATALADPAVDRVVVVQNGHRYRVVPERGAESGVNEQPMLDEVYPSVEPSPESRLLVDEHRPGTERIYPNDPWRNDDPEKAIAAFRALQGTLTEEADRRIAEVYAVREAGTRPPGRP